MIDSLDKAQAATKRLKEESDEFQWIIDKMDSEFGIKQFEGRLPDHMINALISDIVELGFQRGSLAPGKYQYYLYDEAGEYTLRVSTNRSGEQSTLTIRYEQCELA